MSYIFSASVREDDRQRAAFNALTRQTFGFDFEDWYQAGHWGDFYIPHALFDGEKAVSNVSVNLMQFDICGEKKNYVQLGTVMTDEAYRGQGLNRQIMERVLEEYAGKADGIYLFGNDSVLDYYPKFGFRPAKEWEYYLNRKQLESAATASVAEAQEACAAGKMSKGAAAGGRPESAAAGICAEVYHLEKVDMERDEERLYKLIRDCGGQNSVEGSGCMTPGETACSAGMQNPNDGMYMNENLNLYQFWFAAGYGDSIYLIPEKEAYAAADLEGGTLFLHQIFGKKAVDVAAFAKAFAASSGEAVTEVVLGYTPVNKELFQVREHKEEDCMLFILGKDLDRVEREKLRFPEMSHA